jgi:ribonuclease T1
MRKFRTILVVGVLLALAWNWQQGEFAPPPDAPPALENEPSPRTAPGSGDDTGVLEPPPRAVEREGRLPAFLPPEAIDTLALIERGGPFPHRQDGSHFQNRERRLPPRPRGHYREYTVRTPGLGHRGPRRIVTGGDPPQDYWYTDDHYASFRRFEVPQ